MANEDKANSAGGRAYTVSIDGREHTVVIDGNQATVDGRSYTIDVKESAVQPQAQQALAPAPPARSAPRPPTKLAPIAPVAAPVETKAQPVVHPPGAIPVEAPMNGDVLEILVEEGQNVSEGDTLLVLEAMKMEIEIKALVGGTVSKISVAVGEQAKVGQTVMLID